MKKKLNKIVPSVIASITLLGAFPVQAFAQLGQLSPPPAANVKLGDIVVNIVNYAIGSGVLVFFLLFVWGSLEWITSQGDKGALAKARGRITSAAIGLIILACAWAIYFLVKALTYSTP